MNGQTNSSIESPLDPPSYPPLDPPARKRKCHDSEVVLDTFQLVRFTHEMQEITSEELLAKVSQLIPIVDEIKSGKVSQSSARYIVKFTNHFNIGVRMYQF